MLLDQILASAVLILHLLFICWVIFGSALTGGRRILTGLHIASLIYAVVIEAGPWPCPLTALENHFRQQSGGPAYREPFLVHYLEILVYPNVSELLLVWCAVALAGVNLGIYAARWKSKSKSRSRS